MTAGPWSITDRSFFVMYITLSNKPRKTNRKKSARKTAKNKAKNARRRARVHQR